jgi:hypothetical protein
VKKIVLLSLLFANISMINQMQAGNFSVKHLLKNNSVAAIAAVGTSSLLTCWFFHQAAKEWSRRPDVQDVSSSYAWNQFIKGTVWTSFGTIGAMFTIGIANQNKKVNSTICSIIASLNNLDFK